MEPPVAGLEETAGFFRKMSNETRVQANFWKEGATGLDQNVGVTLFLGFFGFILYIGLIALGMFLTFLIIKWAINKSKVNENLEALRRDVQLLAARLQALQTPGAGGAAGAGSPAGGPQGAQRPAGPVNPEEPADPVERPDPTNG